MDDERTYPAGVPCWIDTDQPDVDAAHRFYGGLFGWTFSDAVPPGVPGTYLIASLDGRDVAAIGPAEGGAHASWNSYVAVEDADVAAASVRKAGGSVAVEPADAGPGSRAVAWALRLSTRPAAGTSAICTPRTPPRHRRSTRRCSVGNTMIWGSGR
jgi:uncharacterized protein